MKSAKIGHQKWPPWTDLLDSGIAKCDIANFYVIVAVPTSKYIFVTMYRLIRSFWRQYYYNRTFSC